MPARASSRAMKGVLVSTSWPSSNSVPTATISTLAITLLEPGGIFETHVDAKTASRFDHRGTPHLRAFGSGMLGSHALSPLRQDLDELRESLVQRPLQCIFEDLADPRRETRRRDGNADRARFRDGGHCNESEARLIDAAEQEAMAICKLAQTRRKRRVPRSRNHEERVDDVLVAHLRNVADAAHARARLLQRGGFGDRLRVVRGADHDARAAFQVEANRKERLARHQ